MKNKIEEVALTGIEGQERTLSPERGHEIALATLTWLAEHTGLPPEKLVVGVAQDPRLSGRMLKISFLKPWCHGESLASIWGWPPTQLSAG